MVRIPSRGKGPAWRLSAPVETFLTSNAGRVAPEGAVHYYSRGSERWSICLRARDKGCAFRLTAPVRFPLVALLSIPSPGDPFLINSGPIHARWYGLLLALGVLLAGWIARREFRRRSMDPELAYSIAVWAVPFGLIGARLYHVAHRLGLVQQQLLPDPGHLERRTVDLRRGAGRHARLLDRLPSREAAVLAGGRLHRARPRPGAGAGPLGQLLQPGAVRQAQQPAVGGQDRPGPPHAALHRTRPRSSRCSCTSRSWTCWSSSC